MKARSLVFIDLRLEVCAETMIIIYALRLAPAEITRPMPKCLRSTIPVSRNLICFPWARNQSYIPGTSVFLQIS